MVLLQLFQMGLGSEKLNIVSLGMSYLYNTLPEFIFLIWNFPYFETFRRKGNEVQVLSLTMILHILTFYLFFYSFGATAHIWALAYLHETLRFTSVY
jgi:hypothetical protein